ncbi:MAG TPA: hypothetical protein PKC18_08990 [Lacipirellulaceae bacterium]|nr:hypothetical protein [Lacipirellulaceae bacterium]
MKALLSLAVALTLMACSTAQAARIAVTTNGNVASVFLKGDDLNGVVNALGFRFEATAPAVFVNPVNGLLAGEPRPAGQQFTHRNRALDLATDEGGLGWTLLNTTPATSATLMTFEGGPLGGTIDTGPADGPGLFLANFFFNGPAVKTVGTGQVWLLNAAGDELFRGNITIPEPAALGLGSFALIGIAGLRRRLSA